MYVMYTKIRCMKENIYGICKSQMRFSKLSTLSDIYGILKVRTQLPRVKDLAVKFN